MRDRSYVVAIVARDGVLRAETLRYADEVRSIEDIGLDVLPKPKPAMVKKMRAQIAKLETDQLSLDELQDQHTAQLRELAERKLEREADVVQLDEEERSGATGASVVDLMQVLREKLGVEAESGDEAAAAAAPAPAKKKRRRAASR
jgi:DNA end-binding protein Ku